MKIISADYIISSPHLEGCPLPTLPEYAFIGRSNVGKSSLINALAGKKKLAHISSHPGKTRLMNFFLINKLCYWVDLPGYGYARVSQKEREDWRKMIQIYFQKRTSLVNVFVLIDSRIVPQEIDIEFINQLGEWRIPFRIVFTKTDAVKEHVRKQHIQMFSYQLKQIWATLPIMISVSIYEKDTLTPILKWIDNWNSEIKIDTHR